MPADHADNIVGPYFAAIYALPDPSDFRLEVSIRWHSPTLLRILI